MLGFSDSSSEAKWHRGSKGLVVAPLEWWWNRDGGEAAGARARGEDGRPAKAETTKGKHQAQAGCPLLPFLIPLLATSAKKPTTTQVPAHMTWSVITWRSDECACASPPPWHWQLAAADQTARGSSDLYVSRTLAIPRPRTLARCGCAAAFFFFFGQTSKLCLNPETTEPSRDLHTLAFIGECVYAGVYASLN